MSRARGQGAGDRGQEKEVERDSKVSVRNRKRSLSKQGRKEWSTITLANTQSTKH